MWEDRALKAQAPGRAVHGCLLLWVGCVGPTFCSLPPSQMALCPVLLAVAGWLAGLLPAFCLPGFRELRGMA